LVLFASVSYAGWTPPVRISDEATAYSPRIEANGDTLHVAYWIWTGHAECYYIKSIDNGVSWTSPFYLSDSLISSGEDSPVIHTKGDTIVAIWYQDITGGGGVNLGFRKSINAGEGWSDFSYILPSDNYALRKHTFCLSSSDILVVYSRRAGDLIFEFTKSTDWGETWTEPTEVFRTQETGPFDMVARGDTIHFVWVGKFDYDAEWEIYHIRSIDSGDNWSDNTLLSTPDDRGANFPTISINSAGNIAICWMDYKYSDYLWTGDLFIRYSLYSGENWSDEEQLTFTHGAFANHILWEGDSVHIAWEDWRYSQRDIFYMLSTDNGMSWGDEIRVEDDPATSGAPDIAVVGENRHLVWYDRRVDPGYGIYYSRWEEEVDIDDGWYTPLPVELELVAHPNPFNGSTIITYNQLEGGDIEIYNIRGRKIRTLATKAKGGKIIWDARDALGNKISSGIYFARARGTAGYSTLKLIYLK
jgi:hypothetical protein